MRRTVLTFLAACFATPTLPVGLGTIDRMYVDGVVIEPTTGAVTLLLVVDFPLEDGLTKARAKSKTLSYWNWTRSKSFSEAYPNAKLAAGLLLVVKYLAPQNSLGKSVLSQIDGYAKELGFATRLETISTSKRRHEPNPQVVLPRREA